MLTHLSLFSGIGGLDLAAEWAGFETVGQCEWADFPTKILEKHWPDVPRWRDIHDLTGEDFRTRTGLRTVDVISGGFPCQPFSVAGKQKGKDDERYLFPEMLRVIADLKPRFVVGENVPGILRIAAADVVQSLEREGYECVLFDFEAAAVGAPIRGQRIAFVAEANNRRGAVCGYGKPSADDTAERCRADHGGGAEKLGEWWWGGIQSRPYGVAHGVPDRVDRIKALGNAVVPAQFYPIFRAIAEELHRGTK